MLAQPEDIELLLCRIPVRADPLEHAGSVLKSVRRDRDLRIAERCELSVEVRDTALDDLLSDRRDLVQSLLDRARHDAPPEKQKSPPVSGGFTLLSFSS